MREKKKRMVNTNLGILLICLFSSIFTMADFIIIDHVLDKYFDYSKCECTKCGDSNLNLDVNIDKTPVVEDKKTDDDNNSYVRTTSIKVRLGDRETLADVEVVGGALKVTVNSDVKSFTIANESIKYIHVDYYQSANTNVIFVLTENGNIYVNHFGVYTSDITVFNEFEKMDYSNVSELKIVPNSNYGVADATSGIVDNKAYYIYAQVGEELVKLDYQYKV